MTFQRVIIYHLLTESEVITGKSQTKAWDFPVMTEWTRLTSYLLYGLFGAILKKNTTKNSGSNFQHPLARAKVILAHTKEVSVFYYFSFSY